MNSNTHLPKTIGFIVDGNRRWARAAGKASEEGHIAGRAKFKEVVEWVMEAGVPNMLAYTFSTENWNRPKQEVDTLLALLAVVLREDLEELKAKNCRIKIVGDRSRFSADLQGLFENAEEETKENRALTIGLLLSYGGRDEIVAAANALLREGGEITQERFASKLWTAGIPDPDMIIRTSGEKRLSNFLPWQSTYAELFFTDTLWPDLTREEFFKMLDEYAERERRFGA